MAKNVVRDIGRTTYSQIIMVENLGLCPAYPIDIVKNLQNS